jgi:transcription factor S
MVDFCKDCGAIIMGIRGEEVPCPSCGASQKAKTEMKLSEKVAKVEEKEVIDTNKQAEINPITDAECPECKSPKAYYWTKQTRAGDEPETQFFKCVECAHQWRDYR